MIPLASLRPIYKGQPAAVLGGGPSLEADIRRLPIGTVMISVNKHALKLVSADFMVFADDPKRYAADLEAVLGFRGLKVSQMPEWTDVELPAERWLGPYSSHLATWLACTLGCEPVLLCGMDLYQNPRPPEADPRDLAFAMPLEEHLAGWRQAFERCEHPERIKAMSGPLVKVFGSFPWKRLTT